MMVIRNNGLLLMVLASIVYSGLNILLKVSLRRFSWAEVVFFVNLSSSIAAAVALRRRNRAVVGPRVRLLMWRGLFGFLGVSTYYFTMSRLTLADTAILNKLSTVFVMLFAYFLVGERLWPAHVGVLALSVIGVYNIVQPQWQLAPLAALTGLASAAFAGMAYTLVKLLTADHDPLQIVFAYSASCAVLILPVLPWTFRCPSLAELLLLTAAGGLSTLGQGLMSSAYAHGSPTPTSIASYSVVLFSAVWGYLFFNEVQNPQAIAGSVTVLAALVLLPLIPARQQASRRV